MSLVIKIRNITRDFPLGNEIVKVLKGIDLDSFNTGLFNSGELKENPVSINPKAIRLPLNSFVQAKLAGLIPNA